MTLSKTQIDRLGDRLREAPVKESDLRSLDEYRLSFGEAYKTVVGAIRNRLGLEPTGRPAKSTRSIRDKLLRESIRLTQVQDIAGCRLVVADVVDQDRVVESLCALFPGASVIDRRENPSHGYRAVHVVTQVRDKLVEIQIRSSFQHFWAELSEKFSDIFDRNIKYGGGDEEIRHVLTGLSSTGANFERMEKSIAHMQKEVARQPELTKLPDTLAKLKEAAAGARNRVVLLLENKIRERYDLSD